MCLGGLLTTVLVVIARVMIRQAMHRLAALHRLLRRQHAKTIESKCGNSDGQCGEKSQVGKPNGEPDEHWRKLTGQHDTSLYSFTPSTSSAGSAPGEV